MRGVPAREVQDSLNDYPEYLDGCIDEIVYDVDRLTPTESTAKFIAACTVTVVCLCTMAAAILGVIALGMWVL